MALSLRRVAAIRSWRQAKDLVRLKPEAAILGSAASMDGGTWSTLMLLRRRRRIGRNTGAHQRQQHGDLETIAAVAIAK